MGGQLSECRCNTETFPPNEIPMVRHPSAQIGSVQDNVGSHAPLGRPITIEDVERQISKKNSNRDTSNSTDQFREKLDIKNFSPEGQKILKILDLSILDEYLRTEEATNLVMEEQGRVLICEDGFNYFGGTRNGMYHGKG